MFTAIFFFYRVGGSGMSVVEYMIGCLQVLCYMLSHKLICNIVMTGQPFHQY